MKLENTNYYRQNDKLMIERIIYENHLNRMPVEGGLFIAEGLDKEFFESCTYFYDKINNMFYFYIYNELPRDALSISFEVFKHGSLSLIIFNHLNEESKIALFERASYDKDVDFYLKLYVPKDTYNNYKYKVI